MSDGSKLLISPSDAPDLRYRSLSGATGKLFRVSDDRYVSGEGWSVREPVTLRVAFGSCDEGTVRFQRDGSPPLEGRRIPLPTKPISFTSGDVSLYGELVMPAEGYPRAVVVLQYGGAPESAVIYNYVQHLLPLKDIAVFVFDKRGTGRSTGHFTIDITTLAGDLVAATRAVRAQPAVKGAPLGLMGESQGGWVAPLAATKTPVDFVVVSYGLAVSMLEEDREEVIQGLSMRGYGADAVAKGEELHRAAARVMLSRFREGLDELERVKARYRGEPWFADVGGDFTGPLTSTSSERMPELRSVFDFPYDLRYDPLPVIEKVTVPQLWMLAGEDTEAPHDSTLTILRGLQARGSALDVVVFPHADHGMIVVEHGPDGRRLAGRLARGYFDQLVGWILRHGRRQLR